MDFITNGTKFINFNLQHFSIDEKFHAVKCLEGIISHFLKIDEVKNILNILGYK